jgi:hypothetical protein
MVFKIETALSSVDFGGKLYRSLFNQYQPKSGIFWIYLAEYLGLTW